jgi:hypothetical protein
MEGTTMIQPAFHAPPRPALALLIVAMARLSHRKRQEIAHCGSRAPAAKQPRLRRLTSAAAAEARRIAAEVL